ncbi:basic leucine zipper 34-like [Chenopodium quinoa]|uniref:BZIP domain-containing protein n=1 Tax=Chenopodium quinoa TaxID=63459 RepID=A0A803M4Z4_CHEQI|nr:basic leucine zipper 34-like [Chenopodium quinoa]
MLAECMANTPEGFSDIQSGPCRGPMSLPPKGPSQALYCGPISSEKQDNVPKSCFTDILYEEPPPWLEDLLNEPESPINRTHRRSASDSSAYFAVDNSADELWLRNIIGALSCSNQMPHNFNGIPQASFNTEKSNSAITSNKQQQDKLGKSPSTSTPPSLPNGLINAKEDADCQALGMSCSPEPDIIKSVGSKPEMENSSGGGSDCSHLKPPATLNTDAKRRQHNARRSRVRKLQYIAELERNAQVLQAAGAEVSAQLEFLDQQNLILGMENRALKQRLESLSQEHYIKSMEQEILDKELARLQYLYQLQRNLSHNQQRPRQKQNPAVHRRGKSYNDVDSQLSKLSLHPPKTVAPSNAALE